MNPNRQEGIWFIYRGGDDGETDGNCGENNALKTDRKIWRGDFYYFEGTSKEGLGSTTLETEEN